MATPRQRLRCARASGDSSSDIVQSCCTLCATLQVPGSVTLREKPDLSVIFVPSEALRPLVLYRAVLDREDYSKNERKITYLISNPALQNPDPLVIPTSQLQHRT